MEAAQPERTIGSERSGAVESSDSLVRLSIGQPELDVAGSPDDGPALTIATGGQPQHEALPAARQRRHRDDGVELVE